MSDVGFGEARQQSASDLVILVELSQDFFERCLPIGGPVESDSRDASLAEQATPVEEGDSWDLDGAGWRVKDLIGLLECCERSLLIVCSGMGFGLE